MKDCSWQWYIYEHASVQVRAVSVLHHQWDVQCLWRNLWKWCMTMFAKVLPGWHHQQGVQCLRRNSHSGGTWLYMQVFCRSYINNKVYSVYQGVSIQVVYGYVCKCSASLTSTARCTVSTKEFPFRCVWLYMQVFCQSDIISKVYSVYQGVSIQVVYGYVCKGFYQSYIISKVPQGLWEITLCSTQQTKVSVQTGLHGQWNIRCFKYCPLCLGQILLCLCQPAQTCLTEHHK